MPPPFFPPINDKFEEYYAAWSESWPDGEAPLPKGIAQQFFFAGIIAAIHDHQCGKPEREIIREVELFQRATKEEIDIHRRRN